MIEALGNQMQNQGPSHQLEKLLQAKSQVADTSYDVCVKASGADVQACESNESASV